MCFVKTNSSKLGAILVKLVDHFPMSSSRIAIGKAKPAPCELVDRAKAGKPVTITVHNEPVAQIVAVQPPSRALTDAWRKRVKGIRLNRPGQRMLMLRQLIDRQAVAIESRGGRNTM
jgi:prevent-host-death family protein